MRLLATSFTQPELNSKVSSLTLSAQPKLRLIIAETQGYGLYLEFRPDVDGWGKKAELRMSTILDLRRHLTHAAPEVSKAEDDERPSTNRQVKQEVDGREDIVRLKPEPDEDEPEPGPGPASPSPPDKKVKVEHTAVDPLSALPTPATEIKDEFDALLEEDDEIFAAIDI